MPTHISTIAMVSRTLLTAVLCAALLTPSSVLAEDCPKALYLLYGPFLSPAFIEKTFKQLHDDIRSNTGCEFEYHLSEYNQQYHQLIKSLDYDIIAIPSTHLSYIEPLGYSHVASGFGPAEFMLLGRKSSGINTLKDLEGKRVLLNGKLSATAVVWREAAKNKVDLDTINYIYSANTDQMLFRLLKGEAEATVTFDIFYKKLPQSLKNKLTVLGSRAMATPGSIIIHNRINDNLTLKIKKAFIKHSAWKIQRPVRDLIPDKYADKGLKKVFSLEKKQ